MVKFFSITVAICMLTAASPLSAAPENEINDDSVAESYRQDVWDGLYTAGVHVRYHHKIAQTYGRWDRIARISILFLGTVAFAGPFLFTTVITGRDTRWKKFLKSKLTWGVVGLLAFATALTFNLLPFSDWHNTHAVLAKRWEVVKDDWGRLQRDKGSLSVDQLKSRVDELDGAQQAVESAEPAGYNDDVLAECQNDENAFWGIPIPNS